MYSIKSANITVMVTDMDRSVDFYTTIIGLELKQRWGNHYAMVSAPGITIGLHPASITHTPATGTSIGFGVDNLDEVETHLLQTGITYEKTDDKEAGKLVHLKDPDGTLLYFIKSTIDWQ